MVNPSYISALKNPIFRTISKASKNLNLESYVIGGFVRDFLLKRDEAKDIDIVAVGSGIELAQEVSKLLPRKPKVSVFKTYGTAMLKSGGIELDRRWRTGGGITRDEEGAVEGAAA